MTATKQVQFSSVTVREYPMEIGDNPSCSDGAPVQIGWQHQSSTTHSNIDMYEYFQQDNSNGRKTKLSVQKRAKILLAAGYDLEAIAQATLKAQRVQQQRAETVQALEGWNAKILETTGKLLNAANPAKGLFLGLKKLVINNKASTTQQPHSVPARSA